MICPVSSAIPMKSAGFTRPRSGWFQRISASAPMIAAGREADDRLVVQLELPPLDRPVQVADQGEAVVGPTAHRRVEVLHPRVAGLLLGPGEGQICVAQEVVGRRRQVIYRHADAGSHEDLLVVDVQGRARDRSHPLDEVECLLVVRDAADDDELVAPVRATVSSGVVAMRAARAASSTSTASPAAWPCVSFTSLKSSRSKATTMTRAVITLGLGQGERQPVPQQQAVRQPGECVVQDLVRQPVLRLLPSGDVARDPLHRHEMAVVVVDERELLVDPAQTPVLAPHRDVDGLVEQRPSGSAPPSSRRGPGRRGGR